MKKQKGNNWMANYVFHKDLAVSKKTEVHVAEVLSQISGATIKVLNNNRDFDILLEHNGNDIFIEVKEDFMAAKTGNIAVEYECRGKPSGIATSKSDVYAYVVHEADQTKNLYLTDIKVLKEAINKKAYTRKVVGGDRGSNTKMYIFKKNVFMDFSTKVKEFK